VDCILLHLYGLIGLHLRVIVSTRNVGETETSFLESILFLGGFSIEDLRAVCNGWTVCVLIIPKVHESDFRCSNEGFIA
jgi:hypothetical protein